MKTIACLFLLSLAGAAHAREVDAVPSFDSPRVTTHARAHDERTLGMKKESTVSAKFDVVFPTHDTVRTQARGSI